MSKLAHDWDKFATDIGQLEDDYWAACKNCVYRIEEHSYPLDFITKPRIRHICTRSSSSFADGNEVNLNGFCRYFKPRSKTQPPKDDKLEVVYHGHTVILSNTADGIRIEIKEKKDE